MKKLVAVLLSLIISFSMLVTASAKIIVSDYYLPFDVWQGSGENSVLIKDYSSVSSLNEHLAYEAFEGLYFKDEKVDENAYLTENSDGFIKLILREDYVKNFEDGIYYFKAEYENIEIGLKLYVITEKAAVSDTVFEADKWYGNSSATFTVTGIDYPLGASVLEYISLNDEKIDSSNYSVSFMGNNGIIIFKEDYLKSLKPDTYVFDAEFMSVTGIKLRIEISDYYDKGDADGNGIVNSADARMVLRAAAKLEKLSEKAEAACNVNYDNIITSADARLILRVAAQLDVF